jgi:hypothetical protein
MKRATQTGEGYITVGRGDQAFDQPLKPRLLLTALRQRCSANQCRARKEDG